MANYQSTLSFIGTYEIATVYCSESKKVIFFSPGCSFSEERPISHSKSAEKISDGCKEFVQVLWGFQL